MLLRHWRLKVIAFLLSLLIWIILHYGPSPKKPEAPRKRSASRRLAIPDALPEPRKELP